MYFCKIWSVFLRSSYTESVPTNTNIKSKRLISGGSNPVFSCMLTSLLNFWPGWIGLQAPITEVLQFILPMMPALAELIVCCYIASNNDGMSFLFIRLSSSMQQTPWSASTNAPGSSIHAPFSLVCDTVRPAEVLPIALMKNALSTSYVAACKTTDFPVPGSPINNRCDCPRILVWCETWPTPPSTQSSTPSFTISLS
jgi:hypothetical protein